MAAWIPAAIQGGASLLGGLMGNSAEGRAQRQTRKFVSRQIKGNARRDQDFRQLILSALGMGGGTDGLNASNPAGLNASNPLFNQPQTTESSSSTDFDQSTTPEITPEYQGISGQLKGVLSGRLAGGGLPAGYREAGIRSINRQAAGARNRIENQAASQGLGGAQLAALSSPVEMGTANSIADFEAALPEKARAMQTEDVGLASQLMQMFGRGERRTGRERSTGRSSQSANALQNLLATLGMLRPGEQPVVVA